MMMSRTKCLPLLLAFQCANLVSGGIVIDRNAPEQATAAFSFSRVPSPCRNDAATQARFTLVEGRLDSHSGGLDKLHDGKLPADEDEPSSNFFFAPGTDGGRILVDLGRSMEIQQVNTYSWHPGSRAPQVYKLYASESAAAPPRDADPVACGWRLVANVDTRPAAGPVGGQHGVSIDGTIGRCRYLLFDVHRTEDKDPFGNTFYSELDVIERGGLAPEPVVTGGARETITIDGKYQVTLDTTETPDLTQWAHDELAPVLREWYPKIADLLASPGYIAPRHIRIVFSQDMDGVAATGGSRIRCAAKWFRKNLRGEAKGCVIHELVHVVQQYGLARRANPNANTPGWLVEGIADYVRWFLYEPQSRGAELAKRHVATARYDDGYRVSANFLNWVTQTHGPTVVPKINAALREGRYQDELWQKLTGRALPELGEDWKKSLTEKR